MEAKARRGGDMAGSLCAWMHSVTLGSLLT